MHRIVHALIKNHHSVKFFLQVGVRWVYERGINRGTYLRRDLPEAGGQDVDIELPSRPWKNLLLSKLLCCAIDVLVPHTLV